MTLPSSSSCTEVAGLREDLRLAFGRGPKCVLVCMLSDSGDYGGSHSSG